MTLEDLIEDRVDEIRQVFNEFSNEIYETIQDALSINHQLAVRVLESDLSFDRKHHVLASFVQREYSMIAIAKCTECGEKFEIPANAAGDVCVAYPPVVHGHERWNYDVIERPGDDE